MFFAQAVAGFEVDACGVSGLACQRQFGIEENSGDLVSCARAIGCASIRAPGAPACAPSAELTMLVADSKLARAQPLRQGTPPWPRPNHVTLQIAPLGATEFAGAHFISPSRGMLQICSLRATDFAGARFVTSHDVMQQVASLEATDLQELISFCHPVACCKPAP